MAEKDTLSSRLGFRVFQRFYELTTSQKTPKTFEDFVGSQYYKDFVKFGRHLSQRDAINTEKFTDFVITNGVKLRDWTKPHVYETFLQEHMKKEPAERALERTILTLSEWAEENNTTFDKFFDEVTTTEATHIIQAGRISPWVLYLSDRASNLLSRMTSEQGAMVQAVIDPKIWQVRFANKPDDVEFVVDILEKAGL